MQHHFLLGYIKCLCLQYLQSKSTIHTHARQSIRRAAMLRAICVCAWEHITIVDDPTLMSKYSSTRERVGASHALSSAYDACGDTQKQIGVCATWNIRVWCGLKLGPAGRTRWCMPDLACYWECASERCTTHLKKRRRTRRHRISLRNLDTGAQAGMSA